MPIIKSAIKRMRQAATHRTRNQNTKKDIKSAVKAFLAKPTAKGLGLAQSEIDTAVKKNVLEKNTAARRKAQLSRVAKDAGVKLEAGKKKAAPKAAAKPATKVAAKAPAKKATPAKKVVVKAAAKPAVKKSPAKKTVAKKATK